MEQKKHICVRDELATLSSSDYPWLVAHNLEDDDTGDQVFYRLHDPMSHYRCRIPELAGKRIRGCFHGWMILSKRINPQDIEWSLWNPAISKLIPLPRMILKDNDNKVDGNKDDDNFGYCCLSSPPDDPGSMLLLMRSTEPNLVFVFCNGTLSRRWTEISYIEQMKNINDSHHPTILLEPTCCNGNIYAFTYSHPKPPILIQVQITVDEKKQPAINLVPLGNLPWPDWKKRPEDYMFLKASCTHELLSIWVCVDMDYKPCDVYLYKMDMSSMVWTQIEDLRDTVFFVSLADYMNEDMVYSSPPIASELGGGYVHILEETGDEIHSYNIKDKTISMSSTRCLGLPLCKRISTWTIPRLHGKVKCQLHGDHDHQMVQLVRSAKATKNDDDDDDVDADRVEVEQKNEAPLLNIPFDVLEYIFKFFFGIEYLNFRATCKLCRLAAPLETYSSASPWLMVLDKDEGIITFTEPGHNNYSIKASPELFYHHRILCSRHGWLLLCIADRLIAFFNPFTKTDIIRKIPFPVSLSGLNINFSFSAPPSSPDCMVVAFARFPPNVYFHRVGGEPSWYTIPLGFRNPHNDFRLPIFCGEDVYTLFFEGGVEVFRGIDDRDNFSRNMVVDRNDARSCSVYAKYYQVKCDQHHLLVIVNEYGASVEVFKLNDCTREWEEIDCLGRHMIYICDASCVCMDAKIPEMENKIYFPRLHSENGKLVFYSLETCRFHTFNGRNVEQNLTDLFGTKQTVYAHTWIQPTWS